MTESRLTRYPDARLARIPLLEGILLPYVALMFGSAVAALIAAFNAAAVRRPGLVFKCLAVGAIGWFSFSMVIAGARMAGVTNVSILLMIGRLFHFALGGLLYFMTRREVSGHQFLGGRMVPLVGSYLAAFLIAMYIPWRIELLLLGLPLGR